MKTIKVLSFLLLLLRIIQGNAQVIQKDLLDIVNNSQYIFEGTVIRTESYWNSNQDFIYTSHTLEIHKIFKGNLLCGTIEIITAGGRVGDDEIEVSHNLTLSRGERGLFACNDASFPSSAIDFYPETNLIPLEITYSEQGYFKYYDDAVNVAAANIFLSFDSLAQAYDVVELLTQVNYIDCNPGVVSNTSTQNIQAKKTKIEDEVAFPKYSRKEYEDLMQKMEEKQLRVVAEKTMTNSLDYTFANIQITGNIQKYLEFDIYLAADDNASFFDQGLARLSYDTLMLGSNAVTNGNIMVTRGTIVSSLTDYYNPVSGDITPNVLAIGVSAKANVQNRYNLTTTATGVLHVKMKYKNCKMIAGFIAFTDFSIMQGLSLYTTSANSSNFFTYPTINVSNPLDIPSCYTEITDFNPKSLNGGIGNILEIKGKFFGANQGTGNIFLRDADNGGTTYIGMDAKDFVVEGWSDTLIKIIIPSDVDSNLIATQYQNRAVGSGTIKILTNLGDTASTTLLAIPKLTIGYSVTNYIVRIPGSIHNGEKRRTDLVDNVAVSGTSGYDFYVDSTLFNRPYQYNTVKKANNDWVCQTKAPFKYVGVLSTNLDSSKLDNKNTVIYGFPIGNAAVIMQTALRKSYCTSTNEAVINEIDIVIRDGNNWFLDTTSLDTVPIGKEDFYDYILHEIGHGVGHQHVNQKNAIMYYSSSHTVPIPPNLRKTHLYADADAVNGGKDIVDRSISTIHGCSYASIQYLVGVNCPTLGTSIQEALQPLIVFPNPFDNDIHFQFYSKENGNAAITIIDLQGKEITRKEISIVHGDNKIELTTSTIPQGIYFAVIQGQNQVLTAKIVKQ